MLVLIFASLFSPNSQVHKNMSFHTTVEPYDNILVIIFPPTNLLGVISLFFFV